MIGLVALFATAAAQTGVAEAKRQGDVVVTDRRPDVAARDRRLIERITPRLDWSEPTARFADPICFGTTGLPRELGSLLVDRMRTDAADLGLPVDRSGKACEPTVLVLFVDDSRAMVERLIERRPALFGDMDLPAVQRIAHESGPAHAWVVSEVRSRDGDPLIRSQPGAVPNLSVPTAGRLSLPVRRDIAAGVVMIDRTAAEGRSIDQLAAYALIRGVTTARPRSGMEGETILSLFQPGVEPPSGLTRFDRGYLRGYYAGQGNATPPMRTSQIAAAVAGEAATR